MSLFDKNFKMPKKNSNYMKLEKGENKFRIMAAPITGWLYWTETADGRRPTRLHEGELHPTEAKFFMSFIVYDYATVGFAIAEFTQRSILDSIIEFDQDEDYGDITSYDIKITRKGDGMTTKYSVKALAPVALPKEALEMWKNTNINLDALFDNGDPFADNVGVVADGMPDVEDLPF